MKAQLAEQRTDPNSGLGKAISYLLNHWTKLALFLSQPDSPIDNNMVERAPKKAILSRRGLLANHKDSPKCFALACMRVPHARAANRAYADVRMRESPISVAGPSPVR
jgi:hypothetical protein